MGMLLHAYNWSTGEVAASKDPWGIPASQPSLLSGCCLKNDAQGYLPAPTCMYACVDKHIHNMRKDLDPIGEESQNILQSGQNSTSFKATGRFDGLHVLNLARRKKRTPSLLNKSLIDWTNFLLIPNEQIPYWFWIHRNLINRVTSGPILKLWVGAPSSIEVGSQTERTEIQGKRKRQITGWHGGDTVGPEIKCMGVRQAPKSIAIQGLEWAPDKEKDCLTFLYLSPKQRYSFESLFPLQDCPWHPFNHQY